MGKDTVFVRALNTEIPNDHGWYFVRMAVPPGLPLESGLGKHLMWDGMYWSGLGDDLWVKYVMTDLEYWLKEIEL